MKLLASILIIFLMFNLIFASSQGQNYGQNQQLNNSNQQSGTNPSAQVENQTMAQVQNQSNIQNQASNQTKNQQQFANQSQGISAQVQQIVEQRKNGSIVMPQGILVRIEAQNHVMNVGNETSLQITEKLQLNLTVNGKNKSFIVEPGLNQVNMTDGNVSITTNETLDILNGSLSVNGKNVGLMPSDIPALVHSKELKSVYLKSEPGGVVYHINATKKAKVLFFFDADMDVEIQLDATNGELLKENKPWWAFLASTQD
ncbi:MAG: hypothetical protein ABH842_01635 [Candidatus Micrarchaeota archaeon]